MKKLRNQMIMIIILSLGFTQLSNAQQVSGLYLTYSDYLHHKLSYANNAANSGRKRIIIHEFIGISKVTVIDNGKKLIIPKNEIYGYNDNSNDYRFYGNKAYQIIDTTGFYVYSYEKLAQQGKGPRPTRVYYFSKKDDTRVMLLNAENISKAFPENHKFKYMVNVEAKSDRKLDSYDSEGNVYKIKELYNESLKQ